MNSKVDPATAQLKGSFYQVCSLEEQCAQVSSAGIAGMQFSKDKTAPVLRQGPSTKQLQHFYKIDCLGSGAWLTGRARRVCACLCTHAMKCSHNSWPQPRIHAHPKDPIPTGKRRMDARKGRRERERTRERELCSEKWGLAKRYLRY